MQRPFAFSAQNPHLEPVRTSTPHTTVHLEPSEIYLLAGKASVEGSDTPEQRHGSYTRPCASGLASPR